ncbi:heterokaryon incompatibility protein-domain-containing protein [Stachybotrys elegans]|uniref:Heterokaryon incompatibility protein-domain-containing protein n=1 Tax=Stachybotrys elegans TaxID=80388 RepID=A0A8K0WN54_9HYPO|nr:heterokaryon incompatibility protein-domain-containing protein [Stachybotrys elegans]
MQREKYLYQPLREHDAIRVLDLDPDDEYNAPLCGHLTNTRLSEINQYTALSYVWGDPTPTETLVVNGDEVRLGENLAIALRDMRHTSSVLRVWVDAVCINQSDNDEKSHQVAMMGDIYAKAVRTIIYLGPSTEKTNLVLSKKPDSRMEKDEQLHYTRLAQKDLLRRPWFKRVWTYQEFALSKKPYIQCGSVRVPWKQIYKLLIGYDGGFNAERHTGLEVLRSMKSVCPPGNKLEFLDVLQARRGFGATDPRDLVYAQLGIISDLVLVREYIAISYNMPVPVLYCQVANYAIASRRDGVEALLSMLDDSSDGSRLPNLPSWAPDWRLFRNNVTTMHNEDYHLQETYEGAHCFLEESLVLAHVGYEVDTVEDLSCILPAYASIPNTVLVGYHDALDELTGLYWRNGGVWYEDGAEQDKRPRISLRGLASRHMDLCRELGEQWRKLLEPLVESEVGRVSHETFMKHFVHWMTEQGGQDRVCAGNESSGLLRLMQDYMLTSKGTLDHMRAHDEGDNSLASRMIREVSKSLLARGEGVFKILEGKRLARTRHGRFGVMPAQTQPGDLVLALANCRTLVAARPTLTPLEAVTDALRKEKLQLDSGAQQGSARIAPATKVWSLVVDGEIVQCVIVGASYLDSYAPWRDKEKEQPTKLFAFH